MVEERGRESEGLAARIRALEEQRRRVERALEDSRQQQVTASSPTERLKLDAEIERLQAETERLNDEIEVLGRERTRLHRQDLAEKAQGSERADALENALDFWRQLVAHDPTDAAAREGTVRVQDALARQQHHALLATSLLKYVGRRELDARLYGSIARELRGAHRSVASLVPEVKLVEELLAGALPLEDFKAAWAGLCGAATPANGRPLASASAPDVDFGALSGRLRRGEVVVLIGGILQPPDALADALAEKVNAALLQSRQARWSPPSEIAEYIEMRHEYGPFELVRKVSAVLPRDPTGARLFNLLARVDKPLLVICPSHDRLLEQAFRDAGKKHVVVSAVVDGTADLPVGQIILKYSDRSASTLPLPSQSLSEEAPLEKGYSVLFKVRGVCDGDADPSDPIHRTFMLSEARHFAFARQGEKVIPSYVARHFGGRGLLVLGYSPAFWEDRLVLNVIIDRCRATGERSTVVTTEREGFAGAYWLSRGVSTFSYTLDDFVARLEGAMPV